MWDSPANCRRIHSSVAVYSLLTSQTKPIFKPVLDLDLNCTPANYISLLHRKWSVHCKNTCKHSTKVQNKILSRGSHCRCLQEYNGIIAHKNTDRLTRWNWNQPHSNSSYTWSIGLLFVLLSHRMLQTLCCLLGSAHCSRQSKIGRVFKTPNKVLGCFLYLFSSLPQYLQYSCRAAGGKHNNSKLCLTHCLDTTQWL